MKRTDALAAIVVAALTILPTTASAERFTPRAVAGIYDGTWHNATFAVDGTFGTVFAARQRNSVLRLSAEVGGTGFGCPAVPALPVITLTKGSGANHWDARGFRIDRSGAFGALKLTYRHASRSFTATGTAPESCAPGVTYTITGAIRDALTGSAKIALGGGQTAFTTFTAARQR